MNQCILIAYATKAGSTGEIAAAIAETLSARGYTVDVKPIKEKPSLDGYAGVILGSAIRVGNWLPEAVDFIKKNQVQLQQLPVALFTVHMLNRAGDETSQLARQAYTASLRQLLPQAEAVYFAGKIDLKTLSFLDRMMTKAVEKSTGEPTGDFRDWDKIQGWAETVTL